MFYKWICQKVDEEQMPLILSEIKKIVMKMYVVEPENRVRMPHRGYPAALKAAGHDKLPYNNPHAAICRNIKKLRAD